MLRLTSPYNKTNTTTKQTPIEMLLARINQQDKQEKQLADSEAVNRNYEMLRAGNRESMLRILNNDKISSESHSPMTGKTTQPVIPKQKMMELKSQKDFLKQATKQFEKNKRDSKQKCQQGDMIACRKSSIENPDMDKQSIFELANKLTSEYNTKAKDFNDKLKSQSKANPLTKPTTSDYLINPNTGVIINNPIVQKLQEQEKAKEKQSELINSDAYKLAQEYKENKEKRRQPKSDLINYGGMKINKTQFDYFERERKSNPKQFYIDLQRLKTKQTTGQDLFIKPKQLDKKPPIVNTGGVSVIDTTGKQIIPSGDGRSFIM